MTQDAAAAAEKGISVLQESFENVMQGVVSLPGTVLSEQAQEITGGIVNDVVEIKKYFEEQQVFTQIQKQFSDPEGNFNMMTINEHGGFSLIKKLINEEIIKAGAKLNLTPARVANFQI
ncbi:hypothetical protein HQ571_04455 [Candidatus Kuenenbacteria bacterium]|nr:hypothetical protein [Candidatus Kuenenbacteria bacterium]